MRPLATDEQLAARLGRVHDELIHIGYQLPALAREVAELQLILEPESTGNENRQAAATTNGRMRVDGQLG